MCVSFGVFYTLFAKVSLILSKGTACMLQFRFFYDFDQLLQYSKLLFFDEKHLLRFSNTQFIKISVKGSNTSKLVTTKTLMRTNKKYINTETPIVEVTSKWVESDKNTQNHANVTTSIYPCRFFEDLCVFMDFYRFLCFFYKNIKNTYILFEKIIIFFVEKIYYF